MLGKRKRRQRKAQEKIIEKYKEQIKDNQENDDKKDDPYQNLVQLVNKDHKKPKAQITQVKNNIKEQDPQLIQFIKKCQQRQTITFEAESNYDNYYLNHEKTLNPQQLLSLLDQEKQTIQLQSKAFPLIQANINKSMIEKLTNINLKAELASELLINTGYHKELLDRMCLLKQYSYYQEKEFLTNNKQGLDLGKSQNSMKLCGLELFGLLQTGMDIRTQYENADELKRFREAYLLHIMNQLLQDKERIFTNDKKIYEENQKGKITLDNVFEVAGNKVNEDSQSESNQDEEEEQDDKAGLKTVQNKDYLEGELIKTLDKDQLLSKSKDSTKDQGFTRPKILILTPFKQMAYQIVETIVFLFNEGKWKKISKKKRFREEFGNEEEAFNDYFKVGIAINQSVKTNKRTIKLYEQFYKSDIIVASPLGLRVLTGQETDENAQKTNRVDFDFLSSIEYLVLDQAEAFVFQNMEHLEEVLKVINKHPKKLSDLNDINRIKELYTETKQKLPKHIRQNIVISKFKNIDLDYCLNAYCNYNVFGNININKLHPNRAKQIVQEFKVKFTLRRLPNIQSFEHQDDGRFNFFTKQIWDKLYENNQGYTILFVPSYFDFVRLRTFIKNKNAQVAMISEYSEKSDCQRNRHRYETGEKPILMITERAIVFQKITLRYARNIVLYGLPESIDVVTDCLCELTKAENWKKIKKIKINQAQSNKEKTEEEKLEEAKAILKETHADKSIVGLFSKFDTFQLERIVGTASYKKLISNEAKDSFSFH